MKKFVSLLIIIMITLVSVVAYAGGLENSYENYLLEQERAELFLRNLGQEAELHSPIVLNNLDGEQEAIAFSIKPEGYIIVNSKDLSIPEMRLEGDNPFANIDHPIYNGPLEYYYESGNDVLDVENNEVVDLSLIEEKYNEEEIAEKEAKLTEISSLMNARLSANPVTLSATTERWYYDTGTDHGCCGAIASAIVLKWYDVNYNQSYVSLANSSKTALITLMRSYVGQFGTDYLDMTVGISNYFMDMGINNYTVKTQPFSYTTLKLRIDRNRPLIIGLDEHWGVVEGYYDSIVDGQYIIVNNGNELPNVYLLIENTEIDGTIHFAY